MLGAMVCCHHRFSGVPFNILRGTGITQLPPLHPCLSAAALAGLFPPLNVSRRQRPLARAYLRLLSCRTIRGSALAELAACTQNCADGCRICCLWDAARGACGFFCHQNGVFFGFFKFFYILSLQNRRKRSNISPHPAMSGQRKWLGSSVGRAAD